MVHTRTKGQIEQVAGVDDIWASDGRQRLSHMHADAQATCRALPMVFCVSIENRKADRKEWKPKKQLPSTLHTARKHALSQATF
jgi:hypothetical protein